MLFRSLGFRKELADISDPAERKAKFDQMVAERRMPEPRQASRGRVVWDRHELDGAFDRLPKRGESTGNPWDRIL